MTKCSRTMPERTVGLDLGDRRSTYVVLSEAGEITARGTVRTVRCDVGELFRRLPPSRVVLEVGTHSPWVSRLIAECGHEVLVANPRQVRLISQSSTKNDRFDAEMLARLGRIDPELLRPIQHRGPQAQADRAVLLARDALVRARTGLIHTTRGLVKSFGGRLPACSTKAFAAKASPNIPAELLPALDPVLEQISSLSKQISAYDKLIDAAAVQDEGARRVQQIIGVGSLTAMAFVTTLEDPGRFTKSREVGPFLGLVPRRAQSGDRDPQLGITSEGDEFLRRLLVQSGQYVLGPFGPDCELRRFGLRIVEQGGRAAKRRAVVAVARKLAVLMHRLWVSGEVYDPFYSTNRNKAA